MCYQLGGDEFERGWNLQGREGLKENNTELHYGLPGLGTKNQDVSASDALCFWLFHCDLSPATSPTQQSSAAPHVSAHLQYSSVMTPQLYGIYVFVIWDLILLSCLFTWKAWAEELKVSRMLPLRTS